MPTQPDGHWVREGLERGVFDTADVGVLCVEGAAWRPSGAQISNWIARCILVGGTRAFATWGIVLMSPGLCSQLSEDILGHAVNGRLIEGANVVMCDMQTTTPLSRFEGTRPYAKDGDRDGR